MECAACANRSRLRPGRGERLDRPAHAPERCHRWQVAEALSACKGSRGCTMNCARAGPEPMTMNGSPRSSTPRSRPNHPMAPPIGACAPWPSKAASPRAPCNAGSVCSPSNPTASATSSSPTTPSSSRRCAISSASISTRPTTPSCCVSTRKPRSRRSTAPNRCCRWGWATSKGSPTITSVTAPPPLFAALDIATGQVITQCKKRHRHQEFLAFLRHIDANVPEPFDVHLIADNYATHKHPKVRAGLARRPRYHIHYTPTYASWLNQVERWFGIITQTAIRRGSFSNVSELVNKIDLFVHHYNAKATPFMWTATADSILAKVQRLCSYISGTQH